jgi:dUTP pyrophosphatase
MLSYKRLSPSAIPPQRATPGAIGYDLCSEIQVTIPARRHQLIPTGLALSVPPGTYGRIAPRSGLTLKHGLDVGAGVIDPDYTGPVGVIIFNHSDTDFEVQVGYKIAQLILESAVTPPVAEVADFVATARGADGFGSTGMQAYPIIFDLPNADFPTADPPDWNFNPPVVRTPEIIIAAPPSPTVN